MAVAVLLSAQTPSGAPAPVGAAVAQGQQQPADGQAGRGAGRGGEQAGAPGRGRAGGRGQGGATSPPSEPAVMLFRETWATVAAQPMVQASISNQQLVLHIYGDANEIRKTTHAAQDEHYTYTGETTTNWAITLSDPTHYWDLTGDGRFRMQTRSSGLRTTRVVIKTADGRYFVSEEGSPDSSAWIVRDYIFRDLTWRTLLMTDTPTNASNRREPDPSRVPIIPTARATPDLSRVEEVGFSDLMEGGWIPSTSRVRSWEVWGKAIPR
jgi:hypothetical protein